MSVNEGFKYSVPIEMMAAKENLRVISWEENISKYSNSEYSLLSEDIQNYLKDKQ